MYLKKYLRVKYENINDKAKPNKLLNVKLILFDSTKFVILKKVIDNNIGIEKKKEIFIVLFLSNFKNLPAVIVIPDLLTPGINDSI